MILLLKEPHQVLQIRRLFGKQYPIILVQTNPNFLNPIHFYLIRSDLPLNLPRTAFRKAAFRSVPAEKKTRKHFSGNLRAFCYYSHSMVAGGLEVMSYTMRLACFTSLTMRVLIFSRTSYGMRAQSAVMASTLVTARRAITFS